MKLPEGTNLYDILELTKKQVDQDESLVKKAYRKLALKYHPDKQTAASLQQTEHATQQFLLVGYAYSVLSNSEKRDHYDITGGSDDFESFFSGGKDWTSYFEDLWQGVVSTETIDAHSLKYQGSAEEEDHVLYYYTRFKGNMNHILAHVEHSKAKDVPRFMDLIQGAIQNNVVDTFPAYAKSTTKAAQLRRLQREKEEEAMAEQEALKKNQTKDNKGKQQHDDLGHTSDGNDDSAAEEEEDDEYDEVEDEEDVTLDSLEGMINARQRQRASKFDAMLATMEEAAVRKKQSAQPQPTTIKRKGKSRSSVIDNSDDEILSTNSSNEAPPDEPSLSKSPNKWKGKVRAAVLDNTDDDFSSSDISPQAHSESSASTSMQASVSPLSDKKIDNDTGIEGSRTTITTRSKTKKHTKEIRTKITTVDTDATTTTTSIINKSKTLNKVDQKKRKRGVDADDNDKTSPTSASATAKNKKTKEVNTPNKGNANLLEKQYQHNRSRRRNPTKKTKDHVQ
ncbi:hypothetical protein BCR42DRAFT_403230 [Absidia repens]|uniref:J domain-containing protein n=1 Tax=Absidia repens TaxID=90262 RepID=A0A1X2IZ69_9FUNG|nr:hypothetical protein BCR42DRAFT_403230 [Absidia repens]